jgi:hypothetical protein
MNTQNAYHDPFREISVDDKVKINVTIDKNTYNAIKCPRMEHGTIQITLALLLKKLQQSLAEHNITTYSDKEQYEHFLATCSIQSCPKFGHDRGTIESNPVAKTNAPNVGGRTSSACDGTPPATHSSTDTQSKAISGRKGRKGD